VVSEGTVAKVVDIDVTSVKQVTLLGQSHVFRM